MDYAPENALNFSPEMMEKLLFEPLSISLVCMVPLFERSLTQNPLVQGTIEELWPDLCAWVDLMIYHAYKAPKSGQMFRGPVLQLAEMMWTKAMRDRDVRGTEAFAHPSFRLWLSILERGALWNDISVRPRLTGLVHMAIVLLFKPSLSGNLERTGFANTIRPLIVAEPHKYIRAAVRHVRELFPRRSLNESDYRHQSYSTWFGLSTLLEISQGIQDAIPPKYLILPAIEIINTAIGGHGDKQVVQVDHSMRVIYGTCSGKAAFKACNVPSTATYSSRQSR